jgi:hypothetical protein
MTKYKKTSWTDNTVYPLREGNVSGLQHVQERNIPGMQNPRDASSRHSQIRGEMSWSSLDVKNLDKVNIINEVFKTKTLAV